MKIKELVKGTTVRFMHFQHGEFWYEVLDKDFTFPVPLSDIGDGRLLPEDKGMLFMRYIRKHLEVLSQSEGGEAE